ncbi:MAG: hypothetical protein GX639_13935, partial [Fibrobacter sp.]|nr:hypothetical protein [Fibrobacter sp.]
MRVELLFLFLTFTIIINLPLIIFAQIPDSISNRPPQLLTTPLIQSSPDLLKKGLFGNCTVQATIDSTGHVNYCNITSSRNASFDSLVKTSVLAAIFSPAIENGEPVTSDVEFEVHMPLDTLLSQLFRLSPILHGSIIDTVLNKPIPHARVLLHYSDTTYDTSITTGFNHYLSLIGRNEKQRISRNLLITTSDSSGYFAFRLLPAGKFTVSVQSEGYELCQYSGNIQPDKPLLSTYVLSQLESAFEDSVNEIKIYGKKPLSPQNIDIDEVEKHIGISPYLSNIIQSQSNIRRVPEGPSMMLVRSGCPYDNQYIIAGVSMLSPFHFGSYPYADIDGIMISTLPGVKVIVDDIGGKRIDVSGSIIEATPGKIKYDNGIENRGLYIKGDVGWQGIDLLTAYTSKKKSSDYLQAGYSFCNNYSLKFNTYRNTSIARGNWGIGIPLTYGNATLTGSKTLGPFQCTMFGWFAWDKYNTAKSFSIEPKLQTREQIKKDRGAPGDITFLPWGMGSIRLSGNRSNRSITIGGSHQYFGTGKQHVNSILTLHSFINTGELTADFDTIISRPFTGKLSTRISYNEWNGELTRQSIDTSQEHLQRHDNETGFHLNGSLSKKTGRITSKADLLCSIIHYNDSTQLTGDAGISVVYGTDNIHTGLYIGRVTSRPDIRGLPDSLFRMQLNRTYITSFPFTLGLSNIPKLSFEPYLRYSTSTPQLDPISGVWNPDETTPVFAY